MGLYDVAPFVARHDPAARNERGGQAVSDEESTQNADSANAGPPATPLERGTFANLEQICSSAGPEMTSNAVKLGLETLESLKDVLKTDPGDGNEAGRWLNRVTSLKESVKKTRTVIGILGNTGAGKSSLINALLDEENLLPTNCMRACTAVPTEISYNDVEYPSARYRAEVEFNTAEEWKRDVTICPFRAD